MGLQLGVIADDFTGATDVASFLVANGLTTVQINGVPSHDEVGTTDAIVIGLKSRSGDADQAVIDSLAALDWLRQRRCERFYFKYCSTFDSTAKGNIGPVTDALMDALDLDLVSLCPALPVNGRTVYKGHLFVGDVLLSDSGMRNHPLTPMQDSNVMRLMDRQSRGRSANLPAQVIDSGVAEVEASLASIRSAGARYAVLDTLHDQHLGTLGLALKNARLVTGGSGLAGSIAGALSNGGRISTDEFGWPAAGRTVVLSGSCSTMTNAQVKAYRADAPSRRIEVGRVMSDSRYSDELADWAIANGGGALAPMLYATTDVEDLKQQQQRLGVSASKAIEQLFAEIARRLENAGFDCFIVAGGETSGTVTQALDISSFYIGSQIAPGVPWVRAVRKPISLALKSGNFGDEQFFFVAQAQAGAIA